MPGGRPRGSKGKKTLEKEAAREALRRRVLRQLGPLVNAQISNALGIKYLVTRDKKTGKFIRVGAALAARIGTEETLEVWEKMPSILAFTDLMNRTLDKPAEQVQEIKVTGEAELVRRLLAARTRAKPAE